MCVRVHGGVVGLVCAHVGVFVYVSGHLCGVCVCMSMCACASKRVAACVCMHASRQACVCKHVGVFESSGGVYAQSCMCVHGHMLVCV